MFRFLRKIRMNLLSENKFKKYFLYAIGEIILVVIGILIALQINNWNNRRILDKNEIKSYKNIKQQLTDDQTELMKVKGFNLYSRQILEYAKNIIERKDYSLQDSLAPCIMTLAWFSDFEKNGNIYETLVNNGDIKLMKNDTIPNKLQKLQTNYSFVNKLEGMHREMINTNISKVMRGVINYDTRKPVKPEKMYAIEMQNEIVATLYLIKHKDSAYIVALNKIDVLIDLLDKEINNN